MNYRKLYVCTQCHEFWSSAKEAQSCPGCGAPVCPVDLDYETYAAWTPEEKAAFKADYIASHDLTGYRPTATSRPASEAGGGYTSLDQPTDWIGVLDKLTNISLFVIILSAVIIFFVMAVNGGISVLFGLLYAVILLVAGFASAACMKVFIGMARDLKAVRKKMDA